MGKHTDIFPADLGERPSSEIGIIVSQAIQQSDQPGYPELEAVIDAFQHIFETAEGRSQRELDVFLAFQTPLTERVGEETIRLLKAERAEEANALRKRAFLMLKLAAQLETDAINALTGNLATS